MVEVVSTTLSKGDEVGTSKWCSHRVDAPFQRHPFGGSSHQKNVRQGGNLSLDVHLSASNPHYNYRNTRYWAW